MRKSVLWTAASAVVFSAGAAGAFYYWRGPVGPSRTHGGSVEARSLAEFSSLDAARWVNGAPTSLASERGEVVFIEAWAPA